MPYHAGVFLTKHPIRTTNSLLHEQFIPLHTTQNLVTQ